MLYGLLNLSFWGYVIATLILTQITILSITLYLHRHQAHRAIDLHPVVSHFFRFWLWLTTAQVTAEWVAVHRKHHAKTETSEDPHSPVIYGIRKLLLYGAELYGIEADNKETLAKYAHGTPNDWIEKKLYTPHTFFGPGLMLVLDLLLFGIPGITIWGLQMLWTPLFAAGIINGVGHYWGYRNYEVADASRNIVPWGVFLGGEELHNNHHTYASSAKFSDKWWEIDSGWGLIKLLSWVKLAKIRKLPNKLEITPGKNSIDIETVKAVIGNRFQVMSRYYRQVLIPVLNDEKKRNSTDTNNSIFKRAKTLLKLEPSALTTTAKAHLTHLLQQRKNLQQAYEFRLKLQGVWSRAATSQKELMDALQQWCKQAETSGIDSLMQFSKQLRGYVAKSRITE